MTEPCTVCADARVALIDNRLRQGVSVRAVGAEFGYSKSTVSRHKAHLDRPAAGEALDAVQPPPPGSDFATRAEHLMQTAERIVYGPGIQRHPERLLRALTTAIRALETLARSTGELAPAGIITVNVGVQTVINELRLEPEHAQRLLRVAHEDESLPLEEKVARGSEWMLTAVEDAPQLLAEPHLRRLAERVIELNMEAEA
jgi:hypothetical protein